MKEIELTDERIKKLANSLRGCGDAKKAIEDAFPEVFEQEKKQEEWDDITISIQWKSVPYPVGLFPRLLYGMLDSEKIIYVNGSGFHLCTGKESKYKLEQSGQTFRILKRK